MDQGLARVMAPAYKHIHALNRNTRRGNRRNIVAHYDLGNEFCRLFLDDTMTYSCGIFERADSSLREGSIAKYDHICRKLGLSPADHVLEIGTGWAGSPFAPLPITAAGSPPRPSPTGSTRWPRSALPRPASPDG